MISFFSWIETSSSSTRLPDPAESRDTFRKSPPWRSGDGEWRNDWDLWNGDDWLFRGRDGTGELKMDVITGLKVDGHKSFRLDKRPKRKSTAIINSPNDVNWRVLSLERDDPPLFSPQNIHFHAYWRSTFWKWTREVKGHPVQGHLNRTNYVVLAVNYDRPLSFGRFYPDRTQTTVHSGPESWKYFYLRCFCFFSKLKNLDFLSSIIFFGQDCDVTWFFDSQLILKISSTKIAIIPRQCIFSNFRNSDFRQILKNFYLE